MKIRVSYYDEANDKEINFDGTKEFDGNDLAIQRLIDNAVDAFEVDDDCTIDRGGDDDWEELNIADHFAMCDANLSDLDEVCQKLLAKVEEKL